MTFSGLDYAEGQTGRALCLCLPEGEGIAGVAHPDPSTLPAPLLGEGGVSLLCLPLYNICFLLAFYRSLGEEISEILWEVDRHQWFLSVS